MAVANSTAFRALAGAADATAAAKHVFGEELGRPLNGEAYTRDERQEDYRAYCMVHSDREAPYGKRRGTSPRYEPFGEAVLYLERLVDAVERGQSELPLEIERRWKNLVGEVIDQVLSWIDSEGGPYIREIACAGYGTNPSEEWEAGGCWQGAEIRVSWGLDQA